MNRIIFSFTFLLLSTSLAFCQEDLIYLKNGSIIKGNISENDSTTKVITKDGSIWVFNKNEVTRVEKNYVSKANRLNYLKLDVGFIIGKLDDNNKKTPISVLAVYSIPFSPGLYFGVGTGLEYFKNTYLPILVNFTFQPKKVAFTLQGGFAIPLKEEGMINQMKYNYESGFFFNPEVAYVFPAISGTSFTVSAGFHSQRISAKQADNTLYNDYRIIEKYNRLVLRFGYTFR